MTSITPITPTFILQNDLAFPVHEKASSTQNLFSLFCEAKAKEALVTFQPTTLGVSGFTFLCSIPKFLLVNHPSLSPLLSRETTNENINFVLKWISHKDVKKEVACSKIVQIFQETAPTLQIIPEGLVSPLLIRQIQMKRPCFSPHVVTLVSMPRFLGKNLKDLFQDLIRNQAPPNLNWHKLFHSFGKIALIDLCMANHDRFLRFEGKKNNYRLHSKPMTNTGNVILTSLSPEIGVACIDNSSDLSEYIPRKKEEEEPLAIPNLFGESPEKSTTPSSVMEKHSPIVSELSSHTEKLQVLQALFRKYAQHSMLPELTAHIIQSLTNAFFDLHPPASSFETFQLLLNNHQQDILEGLREELLLMKSKAVNFLPEVASACSDCPLLSSLITDNLTHLKEGG